MRGEDWNDKERPDAMARANRRNGLVSVLFGRGRSVHRGLGMMCLAMILLLLLVGLWPLNFQPSNNAAWLDATNGVHFPGSEARSRFDPGGIAFTPEPLSVPPGVNAEPGSLTIEIGLRPDEEPDSAQQRILVVCDPSGRERFFLGQWTTELLLQTRAASAGNEAQFREFDLRDALKKGERRQVAITSNTNGTLVYLDGRLANTFAGLTLLAGTETMAARRLYLANSPDGRNPWAGDVFALAIYGRALSAAQILEHFEAWQRRGDGTAPTREGAMAMYDFSAGHGAWIASAPVAENALFIPSRLHVEKPLLERPGFVHHSKRDIIVNVLGFVPFGLLMAIWFMQVVRCPNWLAVLAATGLGAGVSFLIEYVQVFLPMRDSSLVDLLCNTGGALVGAWIAGWLRRFGEKAADGSGL